jgi:two-component system phosphate regulon sensor histidine kinase PhoR
VTVTVRDNGHGIPPTEHSRIFQKFYRLDDRLSREREGSGLGLAIVKHVMKAHRGRVELVSDTGKGSAFSLVLPSAPLAGSERTAGRESIAPSTMA